MPTNSDHDDILATFRAMACDYAHLGRWRLVPGSIWAGDHYRTEQPGQRTTRLEPISHWPTADLRRVDSWWKLAPYSILAVTADEFDVICTPRHLGIQVTKTALFQYCPAPVSLSVEHARFLVAPGCTLQPELNGHGITLAPPGALIPMPPTMLARGRMSWLIPPESTQWQPGNALLLQAALHSAITALRGSTPRIDPTVRQ